MIINRIVLRHKPLFSFTPTYRGYAHTDPDGPERVVFILTFISRPQPGIDHRQLSHGTYFHIRPDMYGNTLYDLATPESIRFAWPLRILRSLGIWAPSPIHYGWDWLTTASLRIANDENGYQYRDLVDFVKNSPLIRFVPPFLFGDISKDGGWTAFVDFSLRRCRDAAFMLYALFMSVYFLCAIIVAYNTGPRSSKGLLPLTRRCMITHVPVVIALFAIKGIINKTNWSKSIKAGNIFIPFNNQQDVIQSKAHSTVPEKMDVLVGIRYDAKYLGIYNNYLDFHPGNRLWLEGISTFHGYIRDYPKNIQHLAIILIHDIVKRHGGRFLIQQEDGTWQILNEFDALERTRKKLLPNDFLMKLLEEMRYIYAEVRFGHLKQGMKRRALECLKMVEDKLVLADGIRWSERASTAINEVTKPILGIKPNIRIIPPTSPLIFKRVHSPMPLVSSSSTYALGELIEANYLNEGRWYHGTVASVNENDLIDIVYLDNDKETVPLERIRKFQPIMSGQIMSTNVMDCTDCPNRWIHGVIQKSYPDYRYDLLIDGKMTMHRIPLSRITKE